MKKLVLALTLITLIFTSVAVQVLAAESEIKTLGLRQAIDIALENNRTIKVLEEKIKLAERKYRNALANSDDIKDRYWYTDNEHIANKKIEILYPMQRKAELDELIWQKENVQRNLNLRITELYYRILLKNKEIDRQNAAIEQAKNEYEIKKKQVELGTETENSLPNFENAVNEAETKLLMLQRDLEKLTMDLNAELGFVLDQQLRLRNESLPLSELKINDLDKLVSEVVQSAHSVNKLESDKMLKEKELWILRGYSTVELPKEAETLEEAIMNLEFNIRDERIAVEYNVRSSYNNILNLWDDITYKKLSYDKADRLYKTAKARYDLGLISATELANAKTAVDTALQALDQAKLDYYISVEKFKNYIYPAALPDLLQDKDLQQEN